MDATVDTGKFSKSGTFAENQVLTFKPIEDLCEPEKFGVSKTR
jgi:hypothetical protein